MLNKTRECNSKDDYNFLARWNMATGKTYRDIRRAPCIAESAGFVLVANQKEEIYLKIKLSDYMTEW